MVTKWQTYLNKPAAESCAYDVYMTFVWRAYDANVYDVLLPPCVKMVKKEKKGEKAKIRIVSK